MIRKTFKYRLYPTKRQADILDGQLAEACRLYNRVKRLCRTRRRRTYDRVRRTGRSAGLRC
ncbi:MAG: helix-turn-helix domain-containing protein [Acidobacteria bacterium]|nr:helix-turn-helix domain-containing protein [Acidobacteriota bacterium]